ncbi:metal ABC transporter solute-binding protein, Zn/Mn family [Egicoccus sp. AB-alg2]|uniref:metal ABC transporter solute-binding protein, Zn/Mn family n=1 Tax=Egicoccus sp. AB-alg2 TaxID=3242693 RepID=UPI00359F0B11
MTFPAVTPHRGAGRRRHRLVPLLAALALLAAACGDTGQLADDATPEADGADDVSDTSETAEDAEAADPGVQSDLLVVATTSILGDIVQNVVGEDGTVEVVMPPGADPHGFQPSAADAAMLREADLVVANGLMLEENLVSALDAAAADGVRVFELADQLDPIAFDWDGPDDHGHAHGDEDDGHAHGDEDDGHAHDDDDGHAHGDEDDGHAHDDDTADDGHAHGDDDGHDHGPEDPHIWFDPVRMADGVRLIAAELAEVDDHLDAEEWERRGEDYAEQVLAVHAELEEMFATIAPEDRQLVTNHDALGYLAHRYDFEVLGTVIPGSSTQAEADARQFSELIRTVEEAQVPAVFAENTDSTVLAEQLASEVVGRGDLELEVVPLYTDALGEPGSGAETYLDLLRETARRITDALT